MKNLFLAAKARQSQTRLDDLWEVIWAEDHGTGTDGYRFEKLVAHLASAGGIKTKFIAAPGKLDLVIFPVGEDGKRYQIRCEMKTGCGIVAQIPCKLGDTIDAHGPDEIYPNADVIIYAPRAAEFEDTD